MKECVFEECELLDCTKEFYFRKTPSNSYNLRILQSFFFHFYTDVDQGIRNNVEGFAVSYNNEAPTINLIDSEMTSDWRIIFLSLQKEEILWTNAIAGKAQHGLSEMIRDGGLTHLINIYPEPLAGESLDLGKVFNTFTTLNL